MTTMLGVGCGAIELRQGKSCQGSEHYARASSGVVGLKISCIHKTDSQECKTPCSRCGEDGFVSCGDTPTT